MRYLNIDWAAFLSALPMYQAMPVHARRFFLDYLKPAEAVPVSRTGSALKPLLESGLVVYGATKVNVNVLPEYREFSKAIRAMSRSEVLPDASLESLRGYLEEHLNTGQVAGFTRGGYFARTDIRSLQEVYSTITSASWVRGFLAAEKDGWEHKYQKAGEEFYTSEKGVFDAAKALLQKVIAEKSPVRLSRLPQLCPELSPALLSGALRALFRYLLVFAGVDETDLDPVVGAWPGIGERLAPRTAVPPVPVTVSGAFRSPFRIDDMGVVLSAAAIEPIRMRSNDRQIFEASRQAMSASLGTLPEWLETRFGLTAEFRINGAIDFLMHFGFLKQAGRPGTSYSLKVTETGSRWLSLAPKEKLHAVLSMLRGTQPADFALFSDEVMPLVPGLQLFGTLQQNQKYRAAVLAAWSSLPSETFLNMEDFLTFHARSNNPMAVLAGENRHFHLSLGNLYLASPNEEQLEGAWRDMLFLFLRQRLLPLGCVHAAAESGGEAIGLSLSDAGAYLLGKAEDFELAGDEGARIMVQPNFDIVFLAPSPGLESEFCRFAERKGRHVGTLFRITKASVLNAAASGYTADRVLALLRANAQTALPNNVEREIVGWFGRYRQVDFRAAVLIHCPDEETATRVLTSLGKAASSISPTVLEFHRAKIPPAVAKKLREAGVFLRTGELPNSG
jgi:hypothetical protein